MLHALCLGRGLRLTLLGSLIWAGLFSYVNAASLSLSDTDLVHQLGDTVVVEVTVDAAEHINGIQADVQWPSELLRLESIEVDDSLLDFWVVDPEQRTANSVSFEGVILNPGYIGSDGLALRLVFKAKAQGEGVIDFLSAAVLANDGVGTNILTEAIASPVRISRPAAPVVTQIQNNQESVQPVDVMDSAVDPSSPAATSTLETYVTTYATETRDCQIQNNEVVICTETLTKEVLAPAPDSDQSPQTQQTNVFTHWWCWLLALVCLLIGWLVGRFATERSD